ncbi:interferon-induced, double-stranded RNA-activated protein kinase-like isoform X2 [Phyllobates terribilis]|uniref:interferon-induced, double-stranded RNA-activated protein kinase-like isoform X2 n=1 Tax=Phyllobates terribilis TaxID=111132 RepID=UPI003CCB6A4A
MMAEHNYKGMLIRHCDTSGLRFNFQMSTTGPPHNPRFTACVFVNGEKCGEAEDKTKKAAENHACKMAFLSLQNQDQPQTVGNSASPASPAVSNIRPEPSPSPVNGAASNNVVDQNYVGCFNEFCQRNNCLDSRFVDERRGLPHLPEFFCSVEIGKRKFPAAIGKNKKEAKKNAAYLALKVLKPEYPGDLQLQQISGLDGIEEAGENGAKSESSEDHSSSSEQKTESEPVQSESSDSQFLSNETSSGPSKPQSSEDDSSSCEPKTEPSQSESSDSQITFRSSACETPSGPVRPIRRIELAPKFTNPEPAHDVTTDKICIELAAKFTNLEPEHDVTTDKIFLQYFDNITKLDSGGYGTVYKARKMLDQKYYVVKKVKRRSEKDENEIQTLARLEHKNIVRYYHSWAGEDFCTDHSSSGRDKVESLFIQMEWCAEGTLESWIKSMIKIDKSKSLNIFRQIIDGVEYIHNNNLIHRDLKPANILFAEDMIVKIADFGLVTPISEKHKNETRLRTAGQGTECYMAPEQENKTYENEVDIFPLGLILIELFWKFENKYKYAEWEKLRNAELPPKFVQQYPSEESMIKLMLSRDPKKRPKVSYLKDYFEVKATHYSKTR